jgi:3D (Asp-Asp-Asp) domain-containing protein
MKTALLIFSLMVLPVCSEQQVIIPEHEIKQHFKARITYYNPDSYYGSKVACPKTPRAIKGITVAAHPDFKFGTKVYIPKLKGVVGDGHFIVQDRGSAVTSKKAAYGKGYVFDVYISTSSIRDLTRQVPMWMDVYIIK